MNNLEIFVAAYSKNLEKARKENPQDYFWPLEELPIIVERMKIAFEKGSYNKDGMAIKKTCKELNIPYTYKGINEFIRQNI